jgi:hypothetical protein
MVLGLLGRYEDCFRWAQKAYNEAAAAVTAAIPDVQAALNRYDVAEGWVPFLKGARATFGSGAQDFWAPLTPLGLQSVHVNLKNLISALDVIYQGPLFSDDARQVLRRFDVHERYASAFGDQFRTIPGRRLGELQKIAGEAEEYRLIRVILQPDPALPPHRLVVKVEGLYNIRLAWQAAPA